MLTNQCGRQQGLGAAITASVRGAQRPTSLSDDEWLKEAHTALERLAARPLDADESQGDRERDLTRRRARLADLETIDRGTPTGQGAFAAARAVEDRAASGITGCALIAFPLIQGLFLLMLAVILPFMSTVGAGMGAIGGFHPAWGGDVPIGPPGGIDVPTVANPLLLLASMALVLGSALWRLRQPTGRVAAALEVQRGIGRIFAMQAAMLVGAIVSFTIGWAGLAIGLTVAKAALDVVTYRSRPVAP